jgi:hypothetical protein
VLAPDASPPIDAIMLTALLLCVAACTVAGAWLFLCRLAVLERRAGVGAAEAVPEPVRPR